MEGGEKGRTPEPPVAITAAIELSRDHVPGLRILGNAATKLVFDDLNQAGMVSVNENQWLNAVPQGCWTTDWGHEFLKFITAPPEAK